MLGGCTHSVMKAMFIERHNLAARMILKLLIEGSRGNCHILVDVGSAARLGNLGALGSRLPAWLISDEDLLCEGLVREELRPDILITTAQPPLSSHQDIHAPMHESGSVCSNARTTVWIVEVG